MQTRKVKTGIVRDGVEEILLLTDDGYRITVSWVQGKPEDYDRDHVVWAEYKQCDLPYLSRFILSLIMGDR